MEQMSCNVICDLLPLFADGVLSADSNALVNAHLPGCGACAQELEHLRRPALKTPKTAAKSLKKTRRKLAAILTAALLAVTALLCVGFAVAPSEGNLQPVAYFDGIVNPETPKIYRDDLFPGSGRRGDFVMVHPARNPIFEYYGMGMAYAEDVVTIDGQRVGVLFVQFQKDPAKAWLSARKAARRGGRNQDIVNYGGVSWNLNPMTKEEKAYRLDNGFADETQVQCVRFTRDIPITRVCYYSGPTKKINDMGRQGWSEKNGVLQDSVLVWSFDGTTLRGPSEPVTVAEGQTQTPD